MRIKITTLMLVLFNFVMMAQDVMVTVAPVQQVLPPHALMYVSNPGKYFNVTLTNTSSITQYVYLSMQIDQLFPHSQNMLSTPQNRQPQQPLVVPANGSVQVNAMELKREFGQFSSSEVRGNAELFEGYGKGAFGVMPEGQYQVRFIAYKWSSPRYATPVVISNPNSGKAMFSVAYKANAPMFLMAGTNGGLGAMTSGLHGYNMAKSREANVIEIDPLNAQFTWKEPVIAANARYARWLYSFRVVEVLEGQPVDYAMNSNPVVYQARNLTAPICIIPTSYIRNRMSKDRRYAARVTAYAKNTNSIDYVLLENSGMSEICEFRILPIKEQVIEPMDTLADEQMIAFTDAMFESVEVVDDTCSFEEYAKRIEECLQAVNDGEYEAMLYDSIAIQQYVKLRTNVHIIERTTFAAAKKEGYTQKAKDAFKKIEDAEISVRVVSENTSALYVQAYRSLLAMNKKKGSALPETKTDSLLKVAMEQVHQTKTGAKSIKDHLESVKRTMTLAKTRYKVLSK